MEDIDLYRRGDARGSGARAASRRGARPRGIFRATGLRARRFSWRAGRPARSRTEGQRRREMGDCLPRGAGG